MVKKVKSLSRKKIINRARRGLARGNKKDIPYLVSFESAAREIFEPASGEGSRTKEARFEKVGEKKLKSVHDLVGESARQRIITARKLRQARKLRDKGKREKAGKIIRKVSQRK